MKRRRWGSPPRASRTRTNSFPNDNQPPDIEKTCLELYQEFRRDPRPFFLKEAKA